MPYARAEQLIRDLLRQEGIVTTERPRGARSQNTAALYLQAGDWMLFILQDDRRGRGQYTCVTAVNGPADNDWETALACGYIHTPPPLKLPDLPFQRVGNLQSLAKARAMRRQGRRDGSLLAQTIAVHRARRRQAQAERNPVGEQIANLQRDDQQARHRARYSHRR